MTKGLAALTLTSALFLAAPGSAQTFSTYQFIGNCEDCSPANTPAIATLVLKDYHPGAQLTTSNLVSFTYDSNIVSWDSQSPDLGATLQLELYGSLGTATASYDVSYHQLTSNGDGLTFTTTVTGFNYDLVRITAPPGGLDHGTGTWTLVSGDPGVPETASWTMMIAGFGMVGASLRRRRAAFAL